MTLAAAGMLATSCQDYDPWDGDVAALQFRKDFVSRFGSIDPNHTWNFAEQQAVFVSPGTSQDVKIYAKTDGVYTLAGSFKGIDHAQWLHVDVVAGTTELMVLNGNRTMQTVVGGEVDFSSTRTLPYNDGNNVRIKANDGTNPTQYPYRIINAAKANEYERLLPSGHDNRGRLTEDFLYVSKGPFMLYPQSWGAWANDIVGIYYYDNSGAKHEVEIFTLRGGSEVLEYNTGTTTWEPNRDNISYYKFADYNGERLGGGGSKNDNCDKERSKGFIVDIPEGMTFGIYVQNPSERNRKMYSEKAYNSLDGASHAVTFTMDGELYVGIEDDDTQSDNDLNDIIVCLGPPNIPTTLDQEVTSWVLCYEDLGNTFDIDYNDVVIGVTNAVDNVVTVTPLAAGGTLASYVFYNGNPVGSPNTDADDGEIHGMFGFPKAKSGQYTPINVKANDETSFDTGIKRQVTVGNDFTLSSFEVGGSNATPGTQSEMGGFNVKVVPAGEDATVQAATTGGQTIAPNTDKYLSTGNNIPYVFCVPYRWWNSVGNKYEYYRWSNELVAMTTSFNSTSSFANWVGNHQTSTDWYKYPNNNTTTSAHANFEDIQDGGHHFGDINPIDHERTYMPSYQYEECLLDREEIYNIYKTSNSPLDGETISEYSLEIDKSDLVIRHLDETDANGDIQREVDHDLTTYTSLKLAFVATGLSSNDHLLDLTIFKKSSDGTETRVNLGDGNQVAINSASTQAVNGAEAHADYKEITINNSRMQWSEGDKLLIKVAEHNSAIHLNSIWATIPENDISLLTHSTLASALDSDNKILNVMIANPSTNRPHFIGSCSGNKIVYSGSLAGMEALAETIATAASGSNNAKAQLTLTRVGVDGSNPKVTIKSSDNKYLKNNGNSVQWVDNYNDDAACIFTIVPRDSNDNSSTNACFAGWSNDNSFRIVANNGNRLNSDGPKFAAGTGDWSLWYIIEKLSTH